mmetsp:Transcript_18057/g.20506  ORF Transcript_18057/g.20506 Transcript_18057/m.20506 type:complete len:116 (-) Transcript_18057:426-773(-)
MSRPKSVGFYCCRQSKSKDKEENAQITNRGAKTKKNAGLPGSSDCLKYSRQSEEPEEQTNKTRPNYLYYCLGFTTPDSRFCTVASFLMIWARTLLILDTCSRIRSSTSANLSYMG